MEIPTADEVRKNMRRIGGYETPYGSRYGMYFDGKIFVGIHENDDEIVSIFDWTKGKFVYMDEKAKMGWKLFGEMFKKGEL